MGIFQIPILELIKANRRGVKITIILDQNIKLAGKKHIDKWQVEGKNAWCFKMVKDDGIDVAYDDPVKQTHAKIVVIDAEKIIMGSSNWTQSAFYRNYETNVLIKSKELASEYLKEFQEVKLYKTHPIDFETLEPPLPLSWGFLESPGLAGQMISKHDERSFDLYLLLLRDFNGNPEITLDFTKTAKSLGIYEGMSRTAYRRQIIKVLRKLENRYHLIKLKPKYGKDATVTLLNYNDYTKPYTYPEEWYFELPQAYWDYRWNRHLSFPAKYCYLINLAYASISSARPWWFASRDVLSKRFNVSKYAISKGMGELRRQNIIDVAYDTLTSKPYKSRLAKSYKVLALYNPSLLDKSWDRLKTLYGADKLKTARHYAEIVFEENSPEVVEDIIKHLNALGEKKVKKAFNIVSKKNIDNPKRCYQYVKGILKSEGK